MRLMKKCVLLLLALLAFSVAAGAQETADDPYEFILAKLAADDGRFDEALSRLDKIVAKNPQNAVILYERALILIDASKIDTAEAELRKVVALQPNFYDAERVLGRVLLDRAGTDRVKVDEALVHLQNAFRIYPDDLGTGMAISQIYLVSGRPAEAEKVLASMLERAPDQRGLNYSYAQVLTKLGRGAESLKYLERAVEVDPTFGLAIQQLVEIYQSTNQWQKAAEVLQPLINDDPTNLDFQRQQAFFYLRAGMAEKARARFVELLVVDPKDTRTQYYLAESLSDLERYDEADRIYRQLLEKTPDDPDILASFGLGQVARKKYDEAAKTFRTLLALPDAAEGVQTLAKTQLAFIDLQKGNYQQAIDAAKPLFIFHDKVNPQAINIALDAMKRQKRYGDAVTMMQPLVDKYASDPFVNARYIEMLARAGDKDRARVAASTQSKFGVRNTISAAEAYVQADQYDQAIGVVRDAIRTKPDDVELQFELGAALERSGDKASAEATFLAILEKHPENAGTMNYLGYMWAEQGVHLDRAAEILNKAVTLEPGNGAYLDSLGWAYFRQGKLDLAEKYLNNAAQILPRDATVHEHLGDVLAKRGDTNRALSLYRVALTLDPESKDEAKLRSKIAELEKLQQAGTTPR
ncbi:MAG TPA: tetratricopeptide repeat protein [Thermoanaerobaculia bacterium]|nr:tetratricopeptide repeat protein [Thermoanaerobaculia bacterium]